MTFWGKVGHVKQVQLKLLLFVLKVINQWIVLEDLVDLFGLVVSPGGFVEDFLQWNVLLNNLLFSWFPLDLHLDYLNIELFE